MADRCEGEASRETGSAGTPRAAVLLVLAGVLSYLAVFYTTRLSSLEQLFESIAPEDGPIVFRRIDLIFHYLVRPESLVAEWVGSPAEFSLLDRLPILALATAIVASAAALGLVAIRLVRLDRILAPAETAVFAAAVGLNLLSTYVLGVSLAGLLNRPLVFAVPALLTLVWLALLYRTDGFRGGGPMPCEPAPQPADGGAAEAAAPSTSALGRRKRRKTRRGSVRPATQRKPHETIGPSRDSSSKGGPGAGDMSLGWLFLAVPFLSFILLGGMLPPIEFDVREYHLQVPKEIYQSGKAGFMPHNVYGNMSMGSEMFSVLGMVLFGDWWFGALVGKTVTASFTLLVALALYAAGARFFSRTAGIVAAVLYSSTPWVTQLSTIGFVEGASALYLLLSVYGLILRERMPPHDPRRWSLLGLAGYLAGGAAAVKYPGVLFVIVPQAMWLLAWEVSRRRTAAWKPVGVFLLAAAMGCGLWFGKNAVLTRNPTYPLLYGIFGGETLNPEKARAWSRVHDAPNYSPKVLLKDLADVAWRTSWLGPLLLPFALAAWGLRRTHGLILALWLFFAFVIAAWWLFSLRLDRHWSPVLPLLALLAGAGACWTDSRLWRRAVTILLIATSIGSFVCATSGAVGGNDYFVSLRRLRTDPLRVDPWHRYFNEQMDVGRVLLVGEAQVFDLEVPILYNTWFDDSVFAQRVLDPSTGDPLPAEDVRRTLRQQGISHIYVHWGEIARYRATGYGDWSFVDPTIFERLVAEGVLEPVQSSKELQKHPGEAYRVVSR